MVGWFFCFGLLSVFVFDFELQRILIHMHYDTIVNVLLVEMKQIQCSLYLKMKLIYFITKIITENTPSLSKTMT